MLAKSITALAALAFAANVAVAEPMPYRPQVMKMSVRELFGVVRRQETPGYQPEQAVCGTGSTCEEACGAGYTTCASRDRAVHCFNPTAGQACCPDNSGNSCDAGFYCTADRRGDTWCCPNSMNLEACAAAFSVTGGLVSQTPPPISSSTSSSSTSSSPSSSSAPITSSSTSSSSSFSSSSVPLSTAASSSYVPSASFPATNTTSVVSIPASPTPTTSRIVEGAGVRNIAAPVSAMLVLAAGFAALL